MQDELFSFKVSNILNIISVLNLVTKLKVTQFFKTRDKFQSIDIIIDYFFPRTKQMGKKHLMCQNLS